MNKKIGFIGCGNMGGALIQGLTNSNQINYQNIFVFDKNPQKANTIVDKYNVSTKNNIQELAEASYFIILAVKPNIIPAILKELSSDSIKEKVLISIAAGITIKTIKKTIEKECRVARVMPNTPALVGEGMTAISFDNTINDEEKENIKQIFQTVGRVIEIEEKHMNAITALSGSSPAYVFIFIEAMADAAVRMGIPRNLAYNVAAQAVLGSAKMILDTGKHPGELKDMVCSPAGTTIEAVYQLEKRGFRGTIMKAMQECYEKAEELSKEMGE